MRNARRNILVAVVAVLILCPAKSSAQNKAPVADAGLVRYAATDPVRLDGTGSYDPDNSGPVTYQWHQVAGPSVVIGHADTAAPTISGFVQTDEIQECEFGLVVSDAELTSLADTVKVTIVPYFGASTLQQENLPFDPDKPTVIYFGGGDCVNGFSGQRWNAPAWNSRANIISFPNGYGPDAGGGTRTYYKYGDMIIVYLSSVAPDYREPIQTIGWSTGGQPAIDVGIRLNSAYKDARYAVNRVAQLDGPCRVSAQWGGSWQLYAQIVKSFLNSSVDGEQCWIDFYYGTGGVQYEPFEFHDLLAAYLGLAHDQVRNWYRNSLTGNDMNNFNNGLVAGAYWSVIGPGKNLQLALQTDAYYFRWDGTQASGSMGFFNEGLYPGRLPRPVTLVGPVDVGDPNGALLTCEESENAVGYQLLFGPDPYYIMDYNIISDTPTPPNEVITTLPFDETWWTVRVHDQYGSTIYADPMYINASILSFPIENLTTARRYAYIQRAIDDANSGDEIVVRQGIYRETIDFKGKNLTVRSTDPSDPAIAAATVINGNGNSSVVTFSSSESPNCVLAGFTLTSGNTGIYCSDTFPTIANCTIARNAGPGIQLWNESNATITNCIIAANEGVGIEMWADETGRFSKYSYATITNCTIAGNLQHGIFSGKPTITNSIIYYNGSDYNHVQIESNFATVTYSDIQGGFAGQGNLDAEPLFADPNNGDYHLKSQAGRWDPSSQSWVKDLVTSPCIDTGDPASDWTAELWPHGKRINMGAYGGTAQASMSPSTVGCVADLNSDGSVDHKDVTIMTSQWPRRQILLREDLDRNGRVGFVDFCILADNWLWQE